MTSIFLDEELNTNIKIVKDVLEMITPEFLNNEQNIDAINNLHNILIVKKKEINGLRDINPTPIDIEYIDMYSDAVGDKIILVENRIQELQNVDAAVANAEVVENEAEIGGKRRGRRTRTRMTKRRKNKSSKTRRRNKSNKRRR